ncbi:sulfotransferase domain-containing protein [Nocardioides nematodiphilus]|uniref:sulfotransferase domain-containing protein n=1 Tax=Nocardioides nematodiphilus TaxID=2849669 RepID=UPI001CDA1665|nr:sulfotransferase domain-containing protein [Nocardioides nematodiphilus]MCA1981618.1 sulfotransferase [Nocardioides nematodiphilus]
MPVDYAIVGVQKAGTSTLHSLLCEHPNVASGPEKEMRVFMLPDPPTSRAQADDYARPARSAEVVRAGDATPTYLFWPGALERLQAYDAAMPLIAMFRDPIERAFSQWAMQRRRSAGFPDLGETIAQWAEMPLPTSVPEGLTPGQLRRRSLYVRGLYGQQLQRGFALFPREQWLLLDIRELASDQNAVLDRVTDHLSLPRFTTYPEPRRRGHVPETHQGPAPTVADVQRLVDLYAEDLALFADLSGLDVSRWSTVRVRDGHLAARELRDTLAGRLGLSI